ncbi:MAG: hypothetical protein Pars93KO_09000 [Parasphingorhabdus sp.]
MMLNEVMSIFIMVLVLGATIWFWRKDANATIVVTPFLLFAVSEIRINWYSPLIAVSKGWSPDYYSYLVIIASYISFLAAYILASKGVFQWRVGKVYNYRNIGSYKDMYAGYSGGVLLLASILTIAGLYLYNGLPPLTRVFIGMFDGASLDDVSYYLATSRRDITKGHYFGGEYRGQGIIRVLMQTGWMFVVIMSFAMYRYTRLVKWKVYAIASILPAIVFISGDGTRGGIANQIILAMVFASLIYALKIKHIIVGAVTLIGLLVVLTIIGPKYKYGGGNEAIITEVTMSVVERIFLGNGENTVHAIELVRDGVWEHRFGGVHVRNLISSMPGVQGGLPMAHDLYITMNPYSTGTTYNSATYIADLYVDFGVFGAIIGYSMLGFIIAMIQKYTFSLHPTPLTIVVASKIIYLAGSMPAIGLFGFMSRVFMIIIVIFIFLCLRMLLTGTVPTLSQLKMS